MPNVIDFHGFEDGVPQPAGRLNCWICQKIVSSRAIFCHHCGTIQPLRELDHFTRLALEKRIDLDLGLLKRQHDTLAKSLDPGRFEVRGIGEKAHATKHLEAMEIAYETLRDPIKRGRYWLSLHDLKLDEISVANPMIAELHAELEIARDPSQYDRVAQRVGQTVQEGVMTLMQVLRDQHWQQANAILTELEGLEGLMAEVRSRRTLSAPPTRA